VGLADLTLPRGPLGIGVEQRVDGIGMPRVASKVVLQPEKGTVGSAHIPVHFAHHEALLTRATTRRKKMTGAGHGYVCERVCTQPGKSSAPAWIGGIDATWKRRTRSRSRIVEVENLFVERVGGGIRAEPWVRVDVRKGCSFKLKTRNEGNRRPGNEQPKAFGIKEEKELVPFYGTTKGAGPLMCVIEWPRTSEGIAQPVVSVEHASVPVILRVAVKFLSPGFREVIDVTAGRAPELAGVASRDDGRFLNLVQAQ
jgi:hypothetical protein